MFLKHRVFLKQQPKVKFITVYTTTITKGQPEQADSGSSRKREREREIERRYGFLQIALFETFP